MSELATLLEGGSFFDGPRWHDGRWWVSDFYRERVVAVDPSGNEAEIMPVPGQRSGLGWMPDRSLLVVSRYDRKVLRRSPNGMVSVHADVAHLCGGPLNDMVVDRHGRAYAGEQGFSLDDHVNPTTAVLPQRLGRRHADRRGDGDSALHGLHDRAGRCAQQPSGVGTGRSHAGAHDARGDPGQAGVRPDGCTRLM